MKRALLIVLCLSVMLGCEKSKTELLQARLDNFRSVLPPELREEFDSENYETVARGIDSLLQEAPAFKESYEKLKHEELIDVFSPEEVVEFFREYFVEEIEKLQQREDSP